MTLASTDLYQLNVLLLCCCLFTSKFAPPQAAPSHPHAPLHFSAAPALTSLRIISRFQSSREALVLSVAGSRRSVGAWALIWLLRGGVSCVGGRQPGPSVFISGPGRPWARGQQDPAKHQLLAAFSTDIRRAGHIYATASSR